MHGFQCMAAQLSARPDGCTDAILQGLLSLIFWQRNKRRASSSNGSDVGEKRFSIDTTSGEDDEGFFPIKTASPDVSRPTSIELRRHDSSPQIPIPVAAAVMPTGESRSGKEGGSAVPVSPKGSFTIPGSGDNAPSQPSGSLLSIFSWGSSGPSKQPSSSTATAASAAANQQPTSSSTAAADSTAERVDVPVVDEAAFAELTRRDSSIGSDNQHRNSVTTDTEEKPAPSHLHPHRNSDTNSERTAVNHKIYLVDVMEVPQALEALFCVLENSRSAEQVTGTLKVLEQSVSVTSVVSSVHQELSQATNVLHLRNAENFFAQKDWLVWLCDLLVLFARQAMHAEDHEGSASVFSLSESESITGAGQQGYYGGGNYDHDASGDDSESNSIAGDYFTEDPNTGQRSGYKGSVGSGESLSGRVTAWQQQLIDQYCAPIYNLIRKLMLQDMTANKPGSARRWNEIFRLSLPELNSIQERLLTDLVGSMQNLTEFCDDANATLNLLKNLAALLEQALEKVDLSLQFSVKVVQAIHSLSYKCAPEVRSRIKETGLPDIRKSFVVRCLLDNSQDYYNKVAAISEISSPLMGYITSTDTKPISDVNVAMIVLGMLVEACEDLEFLLGGVDSSDIVLHESAGALRGASSVDDYRLVGSPVPSSTYDRVHILFEVLEVLIESVQNCVLSSAECKKCVTKLVHNIPGDHFGFCLAAFSRNFDRTAGKAKVSTPLAGAPTTPVAAVHTAGTSEAAGAAVGTGESDSSKNNAVGTPVAAATTTGGSLSRSNTITGAASVSTPSAQSQSQSQSQGTYSWWGGWSVASDSVEPSASTPNSHPDKIDAPRKDSDRDLEVGRSKTEKSLLKLSVMPPAEATTTVSGAVEVAEEVQGPSNIRAFISWFCSFDQR